VRDQHCEILNMKKLLSINPDSKRTPLILIIVVGFLWLSSAILIDRYVHHRGTFGDMFGAVNALFSGLAFAGIIYTILLQREELKQQREELKLTRAEFEKQNETMSLQRFEHSFFNLLAARRELIQSLSLHINGTNYRGIDAIRQINDQLRVRLEKFKLTDEEASIVLGHMQARYNQVGSSPSLAHHIGLFLESLLSILNFVAYSNLIEREDDRAHYLSIVASQLTNAERTFLYYYFALGTSNGDGTHRQYCNIELRFRFVTMRSTSLYNDSHFRLSRLTFLTKAD